jgi:hypothetical protein
LKEGVDISSLYSLMNCLSVFFGDFFALLMWQIYQHFTRNILSRPTAVLLDCPQHDAVTK